MQTGIKECGKEIKQVLPLLLTNHATMRRTDDLLPLRLGFRPRSHQITTIVCGSRPNL